MEYPDIFAYDDYRPFLRDWFKARKRITGRKGTSAFARLANCAPGHVQNVVAGRRKLLPEMVPGFCQGLEFDSESAAYLTHVVRRVHPLSAVDRSMAERLIRDAQSRHRARARPTEPAPPVRRGRPRKLVVVEEDETTGATWAHPVIRALMACPAFQNNHAWVAAALMPAIGPVQAAAMLDLIDRGGWGGRPRDATEAITVSWLDPSSTQSVAYHREAIGVARWALHNTDSAVTRFRGSVLPASKEMLDRLRQEIELFEAELRELFTSAAQPAEAADGGPDVVYQLTIQLFPLSKRVPR